MTCQNGPTVAVIWIGEDYTLRLTLKTSAGKLYDLTGVTELTLRLKKADGTLLLKTMTSSAVVVDSLLGGALHCDLNEVDTASLLVQDLQDFDLIIDKGSVRRIAYFSELLSVKQPLVAN